MRIATVAVIGKIVGPAKLGIIRAVQVGIRSPGDIDRFVGVSGLTGGSDKRMPVCVSDIGGLHRDLIGQLVLHSEVVLVDSRQCHLWRPELWIDVRWERESTVRTDRCSGKSGRALGQVKD